MSSRDPVLVKEREKSLVGIACRQRNVSRIHRCGIGQFEGLRTILP